jgi:hypothetical protein
MAAFGAALAFFAQIVKYDLILTHNRCLTGKLISAEFVITLYSILSAFRFFLCFFVFLFFLNFCFVVVPSILLI